MKFVVQFEVGGNKVTKEVNAESERDAIKMVKSYVRESVSYGAGHNYKIVKENKAE